MKNPVRLLSGKSSSRRMEAFARPSQITDDPDYICGQHAPYFVVAIDPLGEIPWKSGKPDGRPGLEDARIIVITSSQASKEYLNLLREKGIAYLISRGNEFHLTEPMEKLKSIFGIERISLQGGGLVNGTFANEKLIDKLSLVVIPFVDSSSSVPTTFETGSFFKHPISPLEFKLKEMQKIEPEGLWLFYQRKSLLSKIICSLTLASTFTVNPGPRKLKVINKPLLIK